MKKLILPLMVIGFSCGALADGDTSHCNDLKLINASTEKVLFTVYNIETNPGDQSVSVFPGLFRTVALPTSSFSVTACWTKDGSSCSSKSGSTTCNFTDNSPESAAVTAAGLGTGVFSPNQSPVLNCSEKIINDD